MIQHRQRIFPSAVLDSKLTSKVQTHQLTPDLHESIVTAVYLDFIPYYDLEDTLRNIQSHLKPGSFASFEFTTAIPHVSLFCDSFIFCALPFMPREYLEYDEMLHRTSTPLLISLHRITELLTSGTSPLIIESITNVTSAQITTLKHLDQELVGDKILRSNLIRKWGEKGWREHRLMISWEVGLLTAGYLAKWIIIVRK